MATHFTWLAKSWLNVILLPATLTVLVHLEEDAEGGVVVEEALVETVTKEDVEEPRVVRMDLHANEHPAILAAREIGFLTRDHYIVEAKDTRAQLQRFCMNLTF